MEHKLSYLYISTETATPKQSPRNAAVLVHPPPPTTPLYKNLKTTVTILLFLSLLKYIPLTKLKWFTF